MCIKLRKFILKNKSVFLRILIDVFLLVSAFFLPWWTIFILGTFFLFYFKHFFEFLIMGFLIDSIFAVPSTFYFHFQFIVSFFSFALFFFSMELKKGLSFYQERQ